MDNREEILKKALILFSSRGYEQTGVQQIVDECGITKPTLYHYFKSKEGVLRELLNVHFSKFEAALRADSIYSRDLVKTLEKMTKELFDFAQDNRIFYLFYLSLASMPRDSEPFGVVSVYVKNISRIIEEMFIKAGEHHGNLKGRHRSYTVAYMGMMNAHITECLAGNTPFGGELVHKTVKQFMYGIFA